MTKSKPLPIILLLICCNITAICQTASDSATTVLNKDLRKGAALIEQGKMYAKLYEVEKEKVWILNQRITLKEETIRLLKSNDLANIELIRSYESEVNNLVEQRDLAVTEGERLNKQLKKQKRKTWFYIGTTAVVTAGIMILIK